mmetsp:Transcript_16399/g.49227  ORF Transcript_16399/g.49227 Transcript_16399/m.49227 type:complete len:281 (-) Transcript_16399:896-1738(-)
MLLLMSCVRMLRGAIARVLLVIALTRIVGMLATPLRRVSVWRSIGHRASGSTPVLTVLRVKRLLVVILVRRVPQIPAVRIVTRAGLHPLLAMRGTRLFAKVTVRRRPLLALLLILRSLLLLRQLALTTRLHVGFESGTGCRFGFGAGLRDDGGLGGGSRLRFGLGCRQPLGQALEWQRLVKVQVSFDISPRVERLQLKVHLDPLVCVHRLGQPQTVTQCGCRLLRGRRDNSRSARTDSNAGSGDRPTSSVRLRTGRLLGGRRDCLGARIIIGQERLLLRV